MTNVRAFSVAALGMTLMLGVAASPADAQDRRPCVSHTEYRQTQGVIRVPAPSRGSYHDAPVVLDRHEVERTWDVVGKGVVDPAYSGRRLTMWIYPACGYRLDEAQIWLMTQGRNGRAWAVTRWVETTATLHGHPRAA